MHSTFPPKNNQKLRQRAVKAVFAKKRAHENPQTPTVLQSASSSFQQTPNFLQLLRFPHEPLQGIHHSPKKNQAQS